MKPKMFEELLESVREGGAILRGQRKPSRRFGDLIYRPTRVQKPHVFR